MNRVCRISVFAVALGLAASTAPRVHAQAAAAEALFNQGRDAMSKGDFETACKRFRASDKVDPAPGTKLNLAACEEKRGKIATAWELFRAVVEQLPPGDDRIPVAKQRATELERRVPHLTINLATDASPDTTVKDGDAVLAPGSFGVALPVDPGMHHLIVKSPGHVPQSYDVALREKERKTIEVAPGEASEPPAGGEGTADTGGKGSNKTLGYVVGGVGAAGVVVGAITGIMVLGKKSTANDHCNEQRQTCDPTGKEANDSGRSLATISTVGWVVGIAGLGLGTYLILTSDKKSETTLATRVAPGSASVALVRHW